MAKTKKIKIKINAKNEYDLLSLPNFMFYFPLSLAGEFFVWAKVLSDDLSKELAFKR